MRTLHLVRHGQYDTSVQDAGGGGLTERGRSQALLTGKSLRWFEFSAIYCSSMLRAFQTATIISDSFPGVPLVQSELLQEVVPVVPSRFEAQFAERARRNPDFGEDSMAEQKARADKAFDYHFRPADTEPTDELIICHGNIIRYFVCRSLGIPVEMWGHLEISHCGVTRIMVESNGQCSLISHNETGHIPPEMQSM